jgi:hypothetical protein
MNSQLFVNGDVSMNSRLFVSSDVSMNARLFVCSDVSLNANLYTLGETILEGDVSMNSQLFVNGDVSMNSRLFVSSDVSMNSRLFVSSDVSLNANLYTLGETILEGDVSMNSQLFVNGDVSMNSRLFVTSDVSMNARLFVSGDSSFNGNVYTLGRTINEGDVSMNSRLFVGGNFNIYGNLIFGSIPVTKYYNWSGEASSTITTPTITINFDNNSFYAKLHGFLYTNSDLGRTSTQIVDLQGGHASGGTPYSIDLITRTTTTFSDCSWNYPIMSTNTATLTTSHPNSNTIYFIFRIELIQTNLSSLYPPQLTSISINSDNLGSATTTTYNY